MNKKIGKILFFTVLAGSVTFLSGCRSNKPDADLYGDDNMYGGTIIEGDELYGEGMDNMDLPMDGDRSMFEAVQFAYDSSQVSPSESGKVEAVAQYLNQNKGGGVIIEGHGDERGSREYNLALGERRAMAVRDYLVSLGVDASVIQTKSLGEEMPADAGHTESAWAKNRRGVFAIY